MTEEEYLRARGWDPGEDDCGDANWWHARHCKTAFPNVERLSTSEAVAAQITEDRRLYNFVRERSIVENGMLFAAPR